MELNNVRFTETLMRICYYAGHDGFYSGNSIDDYDTFQLWAKNFETTYLEIDWDDNSESLDYEITLQAFYTERVQEYIKLTKQDNVLKPLGIKILTTSWEEGPDQKGGAEIDNFEVQGIVTGPGWATPVDDDAEPEFYSVYIHYKTGGVQCIADCQTEEDADNLEALLTSVLEQHVSNKPFQLFNKTDWALLREQKLHLVATDAGEILTRKQHTAIEGIISLIDNMQDMAVDWLDMPESNIFEASKPSHKRRA